jgi:hypothetical protein
MSNKTQVTLITSYNDYCFNCQKNINSDDEEHKSHSKLSDMRKLPFYQRMIDWVQDHLKNTKK